MTDQIIYVWLEPESVIPQLSYGPCRIVVIAEAEVSEAWRSRVSDSIIRSGCRYMVAWGLDCGGWHMAVDWASVVRYDTGLTPCEEIITTTDHEDEPLEEAFWFAKNCAFDLYIDLERTVIVHVSKEERRDELLSAYDAA